MQKIQYPTLCCSSYTVGTRGGCTLLLLDPPATLLFVHSLTPHTVLPSHLDRCTARPRHALLQYKTERYYSATRACSERGSLSNIK